MLYITDDINALTTLLLYGKSGEAYNIANRKTFCSILDVAQMPSKKFPNSRVQLEINDKKYPPTTYWNLKPQKLEQLG